jgi:hypothetical protein
MTVENRLRAAKYEIVFMPTTAMLTANAAHSRERVCKNDAVSQQAR